MNLQKTAHQSFTSNHAYWRQEFCLIFCAAHTDIYAEFDGLVLSRDLGCCISNPPYTDAAVSIPLLSSIQL